jgi:signal transduction histidine kinase
MTHSPRDGIPEPPAAPADESNAPRRIQAGRGTAGRGTHARSLTWRYGSAVASVAACLVVTRLLASLTADWEAPFLLFFVPVMFSAWHGGLGPGLLATGFAAGVIAYGFAAGTGALRTPTLGQMTGVALFIAEGCLVTYLTERACQATESGRLYREAQEANRLRDAFLDTVSHELRAPLSTIVGWTQVLRKAAADRETTVKALESIERNVRVQTRLIDDLLDLSRMLSGRLGLEIRAVELAPLVTAIAETVRSAAVAKAIRLDITLDPSAGPIAGDPARLQQIVSTLVSNAVRITPARGSVRLRLQGRGQAVEIAVSDTGPGTAPELLPNLFELFRRTDGPWTRQRGDLGLGLAIARHLTELHGGTLRVESAGVGWGATFTLSFPVAVTGEGPGRLAPTGSHDARPVPARPPPLGPPTSSRT